MKRLKKGTLEGRVYKICVCETCDAIYKVDKRDTVQNIYSGKIFWVCPDCITRNIW